MHNDDSRAFTTIFDQADAVFTLNGNFIISGMVFMIPGFATNAGFISNIQVDSRQQTAGELNPEKLNISNLHCNKLTRPAL
ncbi:MAG: hypothetical protein GXP17_05080 [Gammaproteobacteria bacterium]|nr:hypothetical protein [Gammaproteobacteria bacterium]